VLGGVASDDNVANDAGITSGGSNGCATYVAGSLEQPGMSAADYCTLAAKVCGFDAPGTGGFYVDMVDCERKYVAQSETGRSCSAGRLCEAQATGSASFCESAVYGCIRP